MEDVEKLPVKVFINNAGFGDCGSFLETDLSKEVEMIHVNIRAMHFLMKLQDSSRPAPIWRLIMRQNRMSQV